MKQATARAAANWRRIYAMPVASVYPSYIAKAEKKGRNRAEVDEIFRWLTGRGESNQFPYRNRCRRSSRWVGSLSHQVPRASQVAH